jgi:hypothetical protein
MLFFLILSVSSFLSAGENYTVYTTNQSDYHQFTIQSGDVLIIWQTFPFRVQLLLDLDLTAISPSPIYISGDSIERVPLTVPFVLFTPQTSTDSLFLQTYKLVNVSVWAFNDSFCQNETAVLVSGDSARFRMNYLSDFLQPRCFFPIVSQNFFTFDYWVDPNMHFESPWLSVYTAINFSNQRGPWFNQTGAISKAAAVNPIFFIATGVHSRSQLAINLNFTNNDTILGNSCQFSQSPVWNGSTLITTSDSNLIYQKQCVLPQESETMWMYLAYAFIADGSLAIIIVIAWCKFRQWQQGNEKLEKGLLSIGQHVPLGSQPLFGRSTSLVSLEGETIQKGGRKSLDGSVWD